MSGPARKRATYADLASVPERYVAEIVSGELRTHPRPAPKHVRASSRLGAKLGPAFDEGDTGPGGFWILDEPELHLPSGDVLVPDLAGWCVERMPELPETAWFELPPDWVCEVLSPSTAAGDRADRADKAPIYASVDVAHVWLVDPVVRTLEVFRRAGRQWTLVATFKGDDVVRAEPFDALALELGSLWAPPSRSV